MMSGNGWESVPITNALRLINSQIKILEDIGVRTVGEFQFFRSGQNPLYPCGLHSIKGFRKVTIDAFENDFVDWLAANAREAEGNE